MINVILRNEKVWAAIQTVSNENMTCSMRYSPDVREDAFGVFSGALERADIAKFEVNRGDIRRFLGKVHPLVSGKSGSEKDTRDVFENLLKIELSNGHSSTFGKGGRSHLGLFSMGVVTLS